MKRENPSDEALRDDHQNAAEEAEISASVQRKKERQREERQSKEKGENRTAEPGARSA